ncbi:MAG TPA: sulfatase [Opitutaceae bacterium]|nr:sulfatase [Opitutaceae bacterium]
MNELTRRGFLGQVAGAAAAVALPGALRGAPAPAPPRRPNVLFFMSDDMRAELGCYGSRFGAQTPNLDALARAGVRFDRDYCQYPLCCPSRSSLLTGRHPTTTGVLGNRTHFRTLHPAWISLPQLFRENGYVSLRAGKIFHGGLDDLKAWTEGGGEPEGDGGAGGHTLVIPRGEIGGRPDYVLPPLPLDTRQAAHSDRIVILDGNGEGHPDYRTADRAIEYLRRYQDQPFFLGCGFVKPHSPPCAPQHFLDRYDVSRIQLTPDFAPWPTVPPGFPSAAIRKRNADLFIGRGASVAEAKQVIRAYLASISWADWNLGRVVAELDRLGLRERTIVVFTADHGYQLGEKGKWSKAGSLFEMGTRVPLLIAAPGAAGNGQVCYRIVESVNLYATLAELCGLPLPSGNEGRSLVPLLNDPRAAWDRPAHSTWSEDGTTLHGVAIRTAEWRYAEFGPEGKNGAMLFDPKADPLEMTNLAGDPQHAAVCAELAALARRYAAGLGKAQS